ncbi:hypothetical protein ACFO0N_08265 [Halobium salinum]|uniref:Uncharacterized protein n=1 Tax=Halobium salinum TaxID=1364940 RepID=A0ABD5PB37_9EURY|nr:hypothetical protein [Halobium salinum]
MNLRARHPAMVVGLGVFTLALAAVLGTGVGGELAAAAVEAAGNDYVVFAVFGGIALLLVFVVAASRALFGQDQARLPDPERVQTAPHPGASFDRVVDEGLGLQARFFGDGGESVRERLRGLAAEAMMREAGVPRETARERVLAGTWTDDADAAAFLAGPSGPSPSMESRVAAAVRGRTWFQHGARVAADEVARHAGVEASTPDADDAVADTSAETLREAVGVGTGGRGGSGGERGGRGGESVGPSRPGRQAAADGGRRTADTVGSAGESEES